MNAEKVIIHRFVKSLEKEVYVTSNPPTRDMYIPINVEGMIYNIYITFNKDEATVYEYNEGIKMRDFLNEERNGHQYLWILKEVE